MSQITKMLPGYVKKKGSIELRSNTGIYISEIGLNDACRFIGRPNEMVSRLMSYVVGDENLTNMVVTRNKNRPGIPEDIKNTVFGEFVIIMILYFI